MVRERKEGPTVWRSVCGGGYIAVITWCVYLSWMQKRLLKFSYLLGSKLTSIESLSMFLLLARAFSILWYVL